MEDRIYYQKREAQELVAAERATCPIAKRAHAELAELYRLRADSILHHMAV